jgi:hypothetical protein
MKNLIVFIALICTTSTFAHSDYCYNKLRWKVSFKVVEIQKTKYEVKRTELGKLSGTISRNDYTQNYLQFPGKDRMDLNGKVYYENWGGDLENRNGYVEFKSNEMVSIIRRALKGDSSLKRLKQEYNLDSANLSMTAKMKYRWFYNTKERVTGTSVAGLENKRLAVYTKLRIFATCK